VAAAILVTGCTEAEAKTRAGLIDVGSYSVFLDLATDPGTVRSRAEIRFRCREPGAATFADLHAPAVNRVTCNGKGLDPGAALSDGRLHLPGLAAGNVLTVDAELGYSPAGRGLTRFADLADGVDYALGYGYPTSAPSMFCCFDQPDLRADMTLTVSTPAGWECVANGVVTDRPAEGRAGTWRFATVPAMKPHDLAVCAGPYVTSSDQDYRGAGGTVRISVRTRRTLAGSAGLARVAGMVRQALAWYERTLGVPCPYRKYDVVFVPDLGPTAVSLPGIMLVSETLLQRMADPGDDFGPLVLSHEVAHLWFGCLVEGRWWDDLWLAEAMATYLSYTAWEETLGLDSPWRAFCMREQATAYRADSLPSTQPVSSPVPNAAGALARPSAITYAKGASVVRQLAALIGGQALRDGLRDYLTCYGGRATTLSDLVGCWSRASGRDLSGWAEQWLRTPGVNTLRPQLTLAADGTVRSLAIIQEPGAAAALPGEAAALPGEAVSLPADAALRTHRVAIGAYDRDGNRLRRRQVTGAEVTGTRTVVAGLAGTPAPDAFIVNDGDLTFARLRFDGRTLRALLACDMDMDDPLTEAVCWNAAWDMTTTAELSVSQFTEMVARRVSGARPPAGIAELLEHVRTGVDYYAAPALRPGLRQRAAAAALLGARRAQPGSRTQRALAVGFAAAAHGEGQLDLLRCWLNGTSLPDGMHADLDLRGQILATLAASDLVTDDDLDAYAAADPVRGEAQRATCHALRPDPAAKEAAWTAALADDQPGRQGNLGAQPGAHPRAVSRPLLQRGPARRQRARGQRGRTARPAALPRDPGRLRDDRRHRHGPGPRRAQRPAPPGPARAAGDPAPDSRRPLNDPARDECEPGSHLTAPKLLSSL
jgi:aminopeptidase N